MLGPWALLLQVRAGRQPAILPHTILLCIHSGQCVPAWSPVGVVQVSSREQLWRLTGAVEDACASWNNQHVIFLDAPDMQKDIVRFQRLAAELEPQLPAGQVCLGLSRAVASLCHRRAGPCLPVSWHAASRSAGWWPESPAA